MNSDKPNKKAPEEKDLQGLIYFIRRRPTLPHSLPCSTIGDVRLNFRVRDGYGCDPDSIATEFVCLFQFITGLSIYFSTFKLISLI